MDDVEFAQIVEDKINEYVQHGYRVFSHQLTLNTGNFMMVQTVFIKEE
ncbi:MAG: hypothetical protein KFW21_02925 [Spirochaetota bacterium]|nr:hypothetical protein [Spirochaetota bacterium]